MIAAKLERKAEGNLSRRVLMRAKSNIGRDDGGFSYELFEKELDAYPGVIASYAEFGEAIEGTAREVLAEVETVEDGDGGHLGNVQTR